jgi:hypothetical protein
MFGIMLHVEHVKLLRIKSVSLITVCNTLFETIVHVLNCSAQKNIWLNLRSALSILRFRSPTASAINEVKNNHICRIAKNGFENK